MNCCAPIALLSLKHTVACHKKSDQAHPLQMFHIHKGVPVAQWYGIAFTAQKVVDSIPWEHT